jgi:hypothetical protein
MESGRMYPCVEIAGEGAPRAQEDPVATTRGVLYVHTVPSALCPHVEWAAGGILGVPVNRLRFEVTEEPTPGTEGERYSFTPDLGIFRAVTGTHGDILVPEDRLKAAMNRAIAGEADLTEEVERLLGRPWDDELEPFRYAGDGAPVRWLHQVV